MDDDGDMVKMYPNKKKNRIKSSFYGEQSLNGYGSTGGALSFLLWFLLSHHHLNHEGLRKPLAFLRATMKV